MEENAAESVYSLITCLCEKISNDQAVVKKLRSKCYEILLGKKQLSSTSEHEDLKGTNTICSVLAWQFMLANKYGLIEHGKSLANCAEIVQQSYGESMLKFLMCLRNVPKESESEDFLASDRLPSIELPDYLKNLYGTHRNLPVESVERVESLVEERPPSPDIWDIALHEQYNERPNWEDYGHPEPDKEKPFLSELEDSTLWVENLPSVYVRSQVQDNIHIKLETKTVKDFVKDLKFLLVGLSSYSFSCNEDNEFQLNSNLTVEGITPATLQSFCKEFISCGTCYKALQDISVPDPRGGKYKKDGFIFAEFCQSIGKYLEFYRAAIMYLPDTMGLLKFSSRTEEIRHQLVLITKIGKFGPFSESGQIPNGVALLNYLYQTVLEIFDRKTLLVLQSILFPCCQVYFSKFLQQWLVEGVINDPYEEFFIKPNYKYLDSRGRTYWTRSFSVCESLVPQFLVNLHLEILRCGKTMHLLKQCHQTNKLCLYLMGRKPHIMSCCVTSEQLSILKQNTTRYYLEVALECGPKIKLDDLLRESKEQDPLFLELVAKKRSLTLRRLELERKKILEEQREKKLFEISCLKEQYDSALQQKQLRIASEVENELKLSHHQLAMDNLRNQLIEREANGMIEYYNELYEISETRKKKIEKHLKSLQATLEPSEIPAGHYSSSDSFHSAEDTPVEVTETPSTIHSSSSLDILNANCDEAGTLLNTTIETFRMARKIKEKVLKEEMGIEITPVNDNIKTETTNNGNNSELSEAQRNKLRVLTSEFGMDLMKSEPVKIEALDRVLTQSEINRNTMMASNACFYGNYEVKLNDNDNFLNENIEIPKKTKSLSLDFSTIKPIVKEKPSPMSVDSTPLSDATISSKMFLSVEKGDFENMQQSPSTAYTQATDEGFNFVETPKNQYVMIDRNFETSTAQKPIFSKRVTVEEASDLSINCLQVFMHDSVSIPLQSQLNLVDNELLKYFINELHYFEHLQNLRDYFFLQNGEFGRNITESLFGKLYDSSFPLQLINCKTLKTLVFDALNTSRKFHENSTRLAFRINSLPKEFDLNNPDVLDCVSLTYKIQWPLNILLPVDTIAKYDEIFKFLIKINRISWVLKKMLMELKMLAKETGKKEIYLMMSPQYRRLHQCRHVMLHFVQTFQNYLVGEVLQPSWDLFLKRLSDVESLDALYSAHTSYIKNVLFLCLLNHQSAPLKGVIQKIFIVILKFFHYLRSKKWKCEDGFYVHPNFSKLESIFTNFEEFTSYFFKVGKKVARSGYQSHLIQLLDMLDYNEYYSNKI